MLLTCGLNYITADLSLREKVVFDQERLQSALPHLATAVGLTEVAILSTCNRTEIYCDAPAKQTEVIQWLKHYQGLKESAFDSALYIYANRDAVKHVMRVACGLDSMVLGEPQIFGQMKQAYIAAQQAGTIGHSLGRLFQTTFNVAKKVRTDTAIGFSPVSIAFAAVKLASKIFSHFEHNVALLIGAGETIELAAMHLQKKGVQHFIFVNRTLRHAQRLAQRYQGIAINLAELPNFLAKADLVFAATASQFPILGKGMVERAIKERKRRPIFMVDLAVPRDIEPEVAALNDIYLYTVDDLQGIVDENQQFRKAAAVKAEEIVDYHAGHFMDWLQGQANLTWIKEYRQQSLTTRDELLLTAQQSLLKGEDPHHVLAELAYKLTNKLIHSPTQVLRQASERNDTITIEQIVKLLGINQKE